MALPLSRSEARREGGHGKLVEMSNNEATVVSMSGGRDRTLAVSRARGMDGQRTRVLEAMIAVAGEDGFRGASVEVVIRRARVSRRTFYELFDSIEDCFSVVLEDALTRVSSVMSDAFEREACWEDGVLRAFRDLLVFFDSDPLSARAWLIESFAAGSWALELREHSMTVLRSLIVEQWATKVHAEPRVEVKEPPPPGSPTIVGAMAAVLGVIHTHLVTRAPESLIVLLGPLMGLVIATYQDPDAVAREVARGEWVARELLEGPYPPPRTPEPRSPDEVEVPGVLRDPRSHRARLCLFYLLDRPGASNRQVGVGAGITSHTHISGLLARLCEMGLLVKSPGRPGLANAWSLSEQGERVAQAMRRARLEPVPGD